MKSQTHKHIRELSRFRFTLCSKCGASAIYQRYCKVCGKPYCEKCQEKVNKV